MRSRISSAIAAVSIPGAIVRQQLQAEAEVAHVGVDRLGDAGVLDLDGNVAAVVQLGAVHLPDRGGGDRLGLEVRERRPELLAEIVLDHLARPP